MVHPVGQDGLEPGQAFGRGLPRALVLADDPTLAGVLTPWPLFADDGRFDRDDLAGESIFGHRDGGLLLGLQPQPVDVLPGDAVLGGDALGRRELVGHVVGKIFGDGPTDPGGRVGPEWHPTHDLDPAGDAGVDGASGDQVVDEVIGLLGGAALAVDGGGRHFIGQPGEQPGGAGHVEALLAGLGHASAHHLLHHARVDAGALDHLDLGCAEDVGRPEAGEPAVALADRRADSFDDYWLRHDDTSLPAATPGPRPVPPWAKVR